MDILPKAVTVFDYTDYREYLRDKFSETKSKTSGFTYRFIAEQAGFRSPGFLTQVLQGKSNLTEAMARKIANAIGLSKMEVRYFCHLVGFTQAKSHENKRKYFQNMTAFGKARSRLVPPDAFELYDHWYYSAIRALLHYYDFKDDYKALAKKISPSITPLEAKKAIKVLERLGFIVKNEQDRYVLTQKHITTGIETNSVLVNNFLVNTLDVGKDAFYRFPKDKRNFSALTLSVSQNGYAAILERIAECRREIVEIADKDQNVDRVYQANFQLFPLTDLPLEENQNESK